MGLEGLRLRKLGPDWHAFELRDEMRHWGDRGYSGWQGSSKLVFLTLQSTVNQFSRVAGEVFLVDYCSTIRKCCAISQRGHTRVASLSKTPSTAHTCSSSLASIDHHLLHLVYAASTSCIILQNSRTRAFSSILGSVASSPVSDLGLRRSSSPNHLFLPTCNPPPFFYSGHLFLRRRHSSRSDTFLFERQWMLSAVRRCYRQYAFFFLVRGQAARRC